MGGNNNATLGIKRDGTLWAWGENEEGELPLNGVAQRSSPTQVGTDTNWALVSDGDGSSTPHNIGTKTDGTLWAWGDGSQGALGQNNRTDRSSPTQVGTDTTWPKDGISCRIVNGYTQTASIKTDGTLWMWGAGGGGALGLNNTTARSSPTQVGTDTNWKAIAFRGMYCVNALKTDGTLWSWGANEHGSSGQNLGDNIGYRSSPTQIGTGTDWSQLTAGNGRYQFSVGALKTNGSLWTWGINSSGGLGLNDILSRSSPTQVGTDTTWNFVLAQRNNNLIATKTDGTMWTTGNGEYNGQNNSDENLSSPVQLGTSTTWTQINGQPFDAYSIKMGAGLDPMVIKLDE